MSKGEYCWRSLIHAAGVLVYTTAVALLFFNGQRIFGHPHSFLLPLFMLLLLIISASVTGLLVLGKPITLYLGGLKREAFTLLFATLAWLVVFIVLVVVGLLVFHI